MDKPNLTAVYSATTYYVKLVDTVLGLRVGVHSAELDKRLTAMGFTTWAYVTAYNPDSVPRSGAENEHAQHALAKMLEELAFSFYPGESVGDDGSWPAEPSYLILGIAEEAARELGRRFGQAAVLVGEIGGPPRLLWCEKSA